MRLSETHKIFALTESANVGSSGVDSKSINMGLCHSAAWILNFGAISSDDALKVYVGAASAAKTTAIAYQYRLAAADTTVALSDTFGDFVDVASTGLTLTATTFDHKCLIVELDSDQVPSATPYVTLEIAGSATTQNISIVAVVKPRFSANSGTPTVIA